MMHGMLVAVAAAALAVAGGPQQGTPSTRPFRSEVGVYRLQVRFVDADGDPISGVAHQDLELFVDGQPRPIVDLMEIDAATLEPANRIDEGGTALHEHGDRVAVSTLSHRGRTPTAARRRFMIFFDVSGGRIPSLTARTAASEFLNEIALPGDLIGLTTYSAYSGLAYVVPFTSERRLIQEALDELAIDPASAAQRATAPVTLQGLIADERLAAGQGTEPSRTLLIEQLRRIETSLTASSLSDALEEMSNALADLQGRKQILLFSTGFANEAMWDSEVREALIAVSAAARRAEVVFHTFHPGTIATRSITCPVKPAASRRSSSTHSARVLKRWTGERAAITRSPSPCTKLIPSRFVSRSGRASLAYAFSGPPLAYC